MNASKFIGNPQVECEDVPITAIANSLGLSPKLSLGRIKAPGAALLGPDYFNLWLDLIGVVRSSSEVCSRPLFRIGEIHIQLLRQRYYYFSDTVLNQGLTAPIKLDLLSPSIPFLEITWTEADGLKESLQGLQHFEPSNLVRDCSDFLKQIARLLRHLKKRGRRRVFLSREDYEPALRQAKEELIALGKPITQDAVAEQLDCDARMIRDWNRTFTVEWREFKRR